MSKLQFTFNRAKFIQSLVFFSKNGVTDLTKLKAAKLLYFADKEHLLRYGRPIIGDTYYALNLGPLPSQADDFLDDAEAAHLAGPSTPEQEEFFRFLDVVSDYWPRFVARGEENYRVFSKSDLGILAETAEKYGRLHWKRLVDLSHEDPAYKRADEQRQKPSGRAPMPYESFFEGVDAAMLKLAEEEQEHRDLVAAIQ
ncbi:MAG TPA: Panacea domain-containing protein [Thermoanaerobaculia bacterium]